jgi:hypothetical protein
MDDWNSILTNLIDEVEFNSKVFFSIHFLKSCVQGNVNVCFIYYLHIKVESLIYKCNKLF